MANCSGLQEGLRRWFKLSSTIPGLDMAYFYNVLTYTGQDLEEREPSSCSMRDWRRGWVKSLTGVCIP